MEPELQDAIKQFIDKFNTGGDFILAEAPNVLREMVVYGRISCALGVVCGLVLLAATVVLLRIFLKKSPTWDGYRDDGKITGFCVGMGVTGIPGVVILFVAIDYSIQAWFTPALYVFNCVMGKLS